MADVPSSAPVAADSVEAESTFQLLERANRGDAAALDVLFARYLKPLQRWTSGRLPVWARDAADTHDLVQDTLLNVFKRIGSFEPRREGAFLAYLRQAVMNRIRNELRRSAAQPATTTFDELEHEHEGSPFEDVLALETCERYEAALGRLPVAEREAVIGRVELGASYDELATNLGKPSPDAARVAVARALMHLAKEMGRERGR
jgi:RNA polymerase sigma factor (sigma-70 family)